MSKIKNKNTKVYRKSILDNLNTILNQKDNSQIAESLYDSMKNMAKSHRGESYDLLARIGFLGKKKLLGSASKDELNELRKIQKSPKFADALLEAEQKNPILFSQMENEQPNPKDSEILELKSNSNHNTNNQTF